MSDRTPKPNTTIYLLRDIPNAQLKAAHTALQADGRTLKQILLQAVARVAALAERRAKRKKAA